MLKTLPPNTLGRDFVCGDLHGCFTLLERALTHVNFDPSYDRVISVGDLVDRGPNNLECLNLLCEPWFHAVKGNHEDLMLGYFNQTQMGQYWPQNGGMWHRGFLPQELVQLKDMLPIVDALPLVITVPLQDGTRFHVLHAELNSDDGILDDTIMADPSQLLAFANYPSQDGPPSVLWGRELYRPLFGQAIDAHFARAQRRRINLEKADQHFGTSLSTIFSGHTVMQQPTKIGQQVNIDTGAFISKQKPWAGLTLAEPLTNRFWKSGDFGVIETQLVTV